MVMPLSGTFAYSTTVPVDRQNAFPWEMKSLEPFARSGDPLVDNRLVGWSPRLYIRDTDMAPDPRLSHPAVYRSEIQLVAIDKEYASREIVSYFLNRSLVGVLKPGDIFHITRTSCGGVGISAIRQGKHVFAVGQVTAVPLGSGISVRTPRDLLNRAQAVFRERDPGFEFVAYPIEVSIADISGVRFGGQVRMGSYDVWVGHGFIDGEPGWAECVSISLSDARKWVFASTSAQLIEQR